MAAPSTLAFLHAHGLDADPAGLAADLRAAVERLGALYRAEAGAEGLTRAEIAAARAGGLEPRPTWSKDPLAAGVVAHASLLRTGLSTKEAAERLGVTEARIRQRLGDRTLVGARERRGWRLPLVQFTPTGELPGWWAVCPRLPHDLAPVELDAWMTTPHPDLGVGEDETPATPRDWLLAGRTPEAVATLARALG